MKIQIAVACTLVFPIVDVIVSTVLYCHGSHLSIFSEEIRNFNVVLSVLDLWATVLIRAGLLLGASAGVLWNRELGPRRVSQLFTAVLLACMSVMTYTLVKMLMLSEQKGGLSQQPWFLCLFTWTCASALGVVLLWYLLGNVSVDCSLGDGGECQDRQRLVDDGKEEEEEEEKVGRRSSRKSKHKKTNSGSTLGRLLRCCSEDTGLLSVAFIFLILYAVCEYNTHTL